MKTKPPRQHYYHGLEHLTGLQGRWSLGERWSDVGEIVKLRSADRVLDVGCAEGLVALEICKHVQHVDAIDDRPERIELAERLRLERGITNVEFSVASVVDIDLAELSYDVILFLGVIQHLADADQIPTLEKLLRAARREIVIRAACDRLSQSHRRNLVPTCKSFAFNVLERRGSGRAGELILATRAG